MTMIPTSIEGAFAVTLVLLIVLGLPFLFKRKPRDTLPDPVPDERDSLKRFKQIMGELK